MRTRWASLLPADTAFCPACGAESAVWVCSGAGPPSEALRRCPAACVPSRLLPRSLSLSLWSPQSVSLSSYFCLQKALNRLAGKDELCQSPSSDASRINCREWLRRCCKGGEGPGLEWKSWGPVGLPTGDRFSWEGPMGSESEQNSPDAAQRRCWTLCLGTPGLTSGGCNSCIHRTPLQES